MENNEHKIHIVTLPDIGEGVVEGEIIEWLKKVGDALKQDEPVVIVMTDKATVELPAPHPGTLTKQHYKTGEIAIKGLPLYEIALAGRLPEQNEKPSLPPISSPSKPAAPPAAKLPCSKRTVEGKALATPATRRIARELGIDLQNIQGSGPEGRILPQDFVPQRRSCSFEIPKFEDDEIEPLVGIPRLMAEKMALSKQTAAHFSYFEQLDATRLVALRSRYTIGAEKEGYHVTYMPFIIRALSLTLTRFPKVNSSLDLTNGQLIIHKQQNIGIAITTKLGLIVPVLTAVQEMSLEEIVKNYEAIKNEAFQHKLHPQNMRGATITVSNFGVFGGGGAWATPIINYPETAILAVSRIQKQPMIRNGEIAARDALNLSWSFDHRVIDGDLAANFSHHFASLLQNPAPLL